MIARQGSAAARVLLLASMVFYVVAGWFDTLLIAVLIGANWILIRHVSAAKARVVLAVALNIGVLVAVKYRVFLSTGLAGGSTVFIDTVLPLGISFYTFQLLAYQIDAVRDPSLRERDPKVFVLFVIFFPQLIAGPIVRARQLLPQLRRLFTSDHRRLRFYSYGLVLCVLGLAKKILFADSLAPIVDDIFFLGPATMAQAWTGAWLFSFQIYFDFSGYSDIAIGCAYLLGIRLPRNFRSPYMSTSPREFWQRWHITLSTWIRDYLYLPLGGGKGSQARQLAILVSVMGVAGLWHGANLTYVVWGLLWGIYIAAHRFASRWVRGSPGALRIVATQPMKFILWTCHVAIIVVLWVFFRAEDPADAFNYLTVMFSMPEQLSDQAEMVFVGCLALMLLHGLESRVESVTSLFWARSWNNALLWGFLGGICLWLVLLPSYTQNPFIYFRF